MRRLVIAVVMVAALPAGAGVAAASHHPAYLGHGDRAQVRVKLVRHGRSLDFVVKFRTQCDVTGVVDAGEWDGAPNASQPPAHIGRHGRFHSSQHFLSPVQRDTEFAGRIGRLTASGTFKTRVQNNEVICDTGVVHWTARRRR